ncbi:MAG: PHP domain-containing protein [Christensenellaceae bacterium]|jgi:putative hydrolase|nr:PHP domain-containing protein [Christensenellaceae bacterium]
MTSSKFKILGDYHTHTYYSDGNTSCRENVESALSIKMLELGITDHGFNNPKKYALDRAKFLAQRKEIEALREEYGSYITILHGVEADIIGVDGTIDANPQDISNMDLLILGYHSFAKTLSFSDWRKLYAPSFVSGIFRPSKVTINRNTNALISAIKKYPVDVLAHINHLLKVNCRELAKAACDYGVYIELNEKHISFNDDDFYDMCDTGVTFIVNSDSHRKENVANFPRVENFINKHRLPLERIANADKLPAFKNAKISRPMFELLKSANNLCL